MYQQSVGFNPGGRLLSGLSKKGDAGAFAHGQAMSASADLNLEREQQNQEAGVRQMQEDSQQRQREAQNKTTRLQNDAQIRTRKGDLQSRKNVFNTGMAFDYASLNKRRQTALQQALLNGLARDF
jgi:hypothetical protein